MDKKITIGKLARLAGVNIQTVRYYERCGLIHPTSKSGSGYRLYGERELNKLSARYVMTHLPLLGLSGR